MTAVLLPTTEHLVHHGIEGCQLPELGRDLRDGLPGMGTQCINPQCHVALLVEITLVIRCISSVRFRSGFWLGYGVPDSFSAGRGCTACCDGLHQGRSHPMKFFFQSEGSSQKRIRWFLFVNRLDRLVRRMERDAIEDVQPQAQSFRKVLPRCLNIHGSQITEQANES